MSSLSVFKGNDGASEARGPFRLPPHNLDAEANVIAGALLDTTARCEVLTFLSPEHFYRDSHRLMFSAIRDLDLAGQTVDAITLSEELQRRGDLDRAGGVEGIRTIVETASPNCTIGASYHAQIVRQKATKRDLIEAANEVLRVCYADQRTAEETVEAAERAILGLNQPTSEEPESIDSLAKQALARFDKRRQGEPAGLSSGFVDLDKIVGGFQPRRLYIVAARPSIGKSAFTLNIADHAAVEGGKRTLFVALEMDGHELAERFLSSRSEVDSFFFRNADKAEQEDALKFAEAAHVYASKSLLHVLDASELTLVQLGAHARRHKARHGLDLLVIDYLQLINGPRLKGENRESEVARVSKRLRGLAKELDVPVIAVAQLSRAVEQRANREPAMADLRESGQIEQDANCVILLHRPECYDPKDQPGIAHAIVAKNRGGATGRIRLSFDKNLTRFSNFTKEPQ